MKTVPMKEERLLQVILAPVISEKATMLADKNEQVIFRVATTATKPEIKAAVELLFKVQVKAVTVLNVKGKNKRFGRFNGTPCKLEEGLCLPPAWTRT
jgi:large subunit ribosomal protein L23